MKKIVLMATLVLLVLQGCSTQKNVQKVQNDSANNVDILIEEYLKEKESFKRQRLVWQLSDIENIDTILSEKIKKLDTLRSNLDFYIRLKNDPCGPFRPKTDYGVHPKAKEMHMLRCQHEISPELLADTAYYVAWGTVCDFGEECTNATSIAKWEMQDLLTKKYGESIKSIDYTTEVIYSKTSPAGGGWYVSAVVVRVKKEDIERMIQK